MSNLKISIGADPELFVKDKKSGEFISAHDLLPGTKLNPHPVKLGAVQVDGVAAEFNITPSLSAQDFVRNIAFVESSIKEFIGDKFDVVKEPVAVFDPGYFKGLPEDTKELGCNPDWNAWTGQVNAKPNGDIKLDGKIMRTAAGHIHIGWGENMDINDPIHFEDCKIITRQLDYYLGMYSLQWDKDSRRRQMYGKAGSFRPKPYGVEYRPLSNVWLKSEDLQCWIWGAAHKAVTDIILNGVYLEEKFGDKARLAIDNSEDWWKPGHELYRLSQYTNLDRVPVIVEEKPKPTSIDELLPLKKKIKKATPSHNYMTMED